MSQDPKQSRGYRNRNPGNIDFVPANRWQGQLGKEEPPAGGGRARFARFDSHENGIRALAALLTTYQDRHGLRTVRGIVNRWAPPVENVTSAYVLAVARATRRGPDDALDLHSYADLRPLVEAIITHELGGQPYAASVIDEGLRRAGVVRPVMTIAAAAETGTGQGALTVGSVAGVAAAVAPAVQSLGGLPPWVGVAVVLSAVALVVFFVLNKRKAA